MEQVTIQIPPGAVHVQNACCPGGCSLMAPDVPIGGFPSIRVTIGFGTSRGIMYLDPGYGSFQHRTALSIPQGTVVEMLCPACGRSMTIEDRCLSCGAPMFRLVLPRSGAIEGCLRFGCHRHRLEIADPDGELMRLYDRDQRLII